MGNSSQKFIIQYNEALNEILDNNIPKSIIDAIEINFFFSLMSLNEQQELQFIIQIIKELTVQKGKDNQIVILKEILKGLIITFKEFDNIKKKQKIYQEEEKILQKK